jgi:predicted AlkP superfamily pyrophosphatase or phosphodiesterase
MLLNEDFLQPRYDRGGFAGLPGRIQEHAASGEYDAVVLFLADGFGWRFLDAFRDSPFLRRISKHGTLEKLTSQFPSTTAAHVTTIHTGLPVGQSGVYEWFYYEPQLDALIAPLLFSFAGDKERDTLKSTGVDPRRLFPSGGLYPSLKAQGVKSFVFGVRDYTPSTYSLAVMQGATLQSYKTLPEALVNLALLLDTRKPPLYVHFYFDKIDSICHEYGPGSAQVRAEIEAFLMTMEHFFDNFSLRGKKVLFMLTADHGAAEVDPRTTVFLNLDKRFTGLERFLRRNAAGELLVPAGSARDMFLYIQDGMLEEALAFFQERLEPKAQVVPTSSLIEAGYFGSHVSPALLSRLGDLVLLPHDRQSVWWYERNRFEQRFYGHHGGLTAGELEIPLFIWSD